MARFMLLCVDFGIYICKIVDLEHLNWLRNHPLHIRIGLVARICRSHPSFGGQLRQGRGSIPRFGNYLLLS
jgi:hypothetical protein